MPTPIFDCVVQYGKLKMERRDRFEKYLQGLNGKYSLIIKKKTKPRSIEQNNYYWGVIIKMIADEMGHYGREEMLRIHDALRHMFLCDDGLIPKSTTDLSTVQAEEYYAKIRMWASEFLNLYIPLPNEITY